MRSSSTLALLLFAQVGAAINPAFAKNITIFHVNPKEYGAIPINMDTGDAPGDMFFDLHNVILVPLQCPHGAASGHGCANPEAVAPDLVVNKLILEVDTRFSDYAKCNIGVNGSDAHGHKCKDDTYCCFCADDWGRTVPCNTTLGQANVKQYFSGGGHHGGCSTESPAECYRENAAKKFTDAVPGYWYSSLDIGYCGDKQPSDANCTWRVISVDKIVNKTCHNDRYFSAVEKVNPSCFSDCGPGPRNTSSACWINCFYTTALGPDSGKPGGAVTGMPLDDLVNAWTAPFDSTDPAKGGCPPL